MTPMLHVNAYTGGTAVPSARFRVRQYIPELRRLGIGMRELGARFGSYPPSQRALRPAWGIATITERLSAALRFRDADVTLLQREMVSTLPTVERFTKAPRVFDVDDAIWLHRQGRAAVTIARFCTAVICGSSYIAEFFDSCGAIVTVLPTAVDTDRFAPSLPREANASVICWSGTSSGLRFLTAIERPLSAVLSADKRRRLRIVSNVRPRLDLIPADQVEFVPWSEDVEVTAIQNSDVAIMPLDNSPWARGKCSYKLLTYMACGIPVVASPVGMNAEVLAKGPIGYAARTTDEWIDALESILADADLRSAMGATGREVAVRDYSVKALAPRLAGILRSSAERAA
jgi:glycosyltransferase involved in cell wall biosynthesis